MNEENYNVNDSLFDEKSNEGVIKEVQEEKESLREYRKNLMIYGGERNSLIFLLLNLVPAILSWITVIMIMASNLTVLQNDQITNLVYLKPISLIVGIIVSVMPIGLLIIYLGSLKLDINRILKGINIIQIYLKVLYVLLVFSAVVLGMGGIILLFTIGFIAIIYIIIVGGMLWFYFMFVLLQIDFVADCKHALTSNNSEKRRRPRPMRFNGYLITLIVFSIISVLINGFSFDVDTPFLYPSTVEAYRIVNIITLIMAIVQIGKLSFAMYLIRDFNRYLLKIK